MLRWLLIIVFFSGLFFWQLQVHQSPSPTENPRETVNGIPSSKPNSSSPDYTLTNMNSEQLDRNGQLHYRLNAEHLKHYTHPEHATLKVPHIFLSDPKKGFWQGDAQSGALYERENKLVLTGNVILKKIQQEKTTVTLKTESLNVYPTKEILDTNKRVSIRTPQAQISATGMTISLQKGTIELQSNVRGRYAP